jgi:DNA repair protein RadC
MLAREPDAGSYTRARLDYHATVRELPSHERPRERLEHFGPQALSLAELLAIILDTEQMRVLLLDAKSQLVEKVSLYQGTANSSVLRAAEVFRLAIIRNCPGLILCHNHPSGDPTPSPEDIEATKQLVAAGRILDIELVDHLIIGHQRFVSLKEHLRWE